MIFDVQVTIRVRVRAHDKNRAENHVLNMLDMHLSDMLDSPAVIQTGVILNATNPHSEELPAPDPEATLAHWEG